MNKARVIADFLIDSLSYVRYFFRMKEGDGKLDGDALLAVLAALANPHRLRVVAALASGGRNYVSQLARDIGISRPLLHLHLQKLEEAGLVTSRMELSSEGKALNYYEVCNFALTLTPAAILAAAKTLSSKLEP